jgi:hypothetical protein
MAGTIAKQQRGPNILHIHKIFILSGLKAEVHKREKPHTYNSAGVKPKIFLVHEDHSP